MFYLQLFCYLWTALSIFSIVFLIGFAYWAEYENKKHQEKIRKMITEEPLG